MEHSQLVFTAEKLFIRYASITIWIDVEPKDPKILYKSPFNQSWHIERYFNPFLEDIFDMANKKSKKAKSAYSGFEFYTRNLTAEEKDVFIELMRKPQILIDDMVTVLESGIKASISYDENNSTFISSFTVRDEESPNSGKVVTSRHSQWDNALLLGVFKIHHLLGYDRWSEDTTDDNWG